MKTSGIQSDVRNLKRAVHQRLAAWVPVVLWAALIFHCSSLPRTRLPVLWDFPGSDLIYHGIEFSVFGALLYRALALPHAGGGAGKLFLWAWALAALYALSDELHQSLVPTRAAAPLRFRRRRPGGGPRHCRPPVSVQTL